MIEDSRATKGRKPRSLADLRAKSMALYSGLIGKKDVNFSLLRDTYFGVSLLHLLPSNIHSQDCVHAKSLWLCPTLCDPMNCSPPGSSIHGVLQARILEWVAMPSDLPNPGIKPVSPAVPTLQADSLPLSHRESPLDFFR